MLKLSLLLALLLAWPALTVFAADITVTGDSAGQCSLADAITAANDDTPTGGCNAGNGADTIILASGGRETYDPGATLSITSDITITGNNNTISGGSVRFIFDLPTSSATPAPRLQLNNLTLVDAWGAVRVYSGTSLVMNNVTANGAAIGSNLSSSSGNVINIWGGSATIDNSEFDNNNEGRVFRLADTGSSLTLSNSVVRNGNQGGEGGAILATRGSVTITNSAFFGNRADNTGGAIQFGGFDTLRITNSSFYNNVSGGSGGAIFADRGTVILDHITVTGNRSLANADAIDGLGRSNVTLKNSIVSGNTHGASSSPQANGDCDSNVVDTSSNNFIGEGSCSAAASGNALLFSARGRKPTYIPLLRGSPALSLVPLAECQSTDAVGNSRPQPSSDTHCDAGAHESTGIDPGSGSGGKSVAARPAATPTPKPQVHSGERLLRQGYGLSAAHGLRSGVQFRRLGASGIGIVWVIDMGFLDAVDVWGFVEQGVAICFPPERGHGGLMFLDAATSPRAAAPLASEIRDGYTCASINRAGTVVLVSNAPQPSQLPVPTGLPTTVLRDCMVQTNAILNFRDGPAGNVIEPLIPYGVRLTALERTDSWFKVDYHGARGWISAGHVELIGACGM